MVAGVVTGCGGGHPIMPGETDAKAACQGSGSAAALAATKAAAVNPAYARLAADENALATKQSTQMAELSDDNPADDAGLGAVTAGVDIGSAAQQQVVADCVALGLPVTHR